MTDLERAARAVAKAGGAPFAWDEAPAEFHTACREAATAVIESVLLEPSEEVVEAAWHAYYTNSKRNSLTGMRAALRAAALAILGRTDG